MPFISASAISPYNNIKGGASGPTPPAGFSFGNALKFDGVNDAVIFSDGEVGNNRSTMTVSFWVNLEADVDGFFMGSRSVAAGNQNGWVIAKSNNPALGWVVQFRAPGDGTGSYQTYNQTKFDIYDEWAHVVCLYDGSQTNTLRIKMYFNGIYVGYNYIAPAPPSQLSSIAGNAFSIGDNALQSNRPTKCELNELAVWYDALNDDQILYLYNNGLGNFASDVNPETLKRYYRFNGSGSDTTLIDEGLDGVDGTLDGFTRPPEYWVQGE